MAAFTAARTGDARRATSLVEQIERDNPTDTLLKYYWLPTIHAAIELDNGDAARAVGELKVTTEYEPRAAYQRFFEIWNSSDANVPILKQAQGEYARIREALAP